MSRRPTPAQVATAPAAFARLRPADRRTLRANGFGEYVDELDVLAKAEAPAEEPEPTLAEQLVELAWDRLPAVEAYAVDVALRGDPSTSPGRDIIEARIDAWRPIMCRARGLDGPTRGALLVIMGGHLRSPATRDEVLLTPWPPGHRLHPDTIGGGEES